MPAAVMLHNVIATFGKKSERTVLGKREISFFLMSNRKEIIYGKKF
jgi:hypothetical protein